MVKEEPQGNGYRERVSSGERVEVSTAISSRRRQKDPSFRQLPYGTRSGWSRSPQMQQKYRTMRHKPFMSKQRRFMRKKSGPMKNVRHSCGDLSKGLVKNSSTADWEFLATVLKSGTVTDKVSALTLMVQESPLHTLPVLKDHLLNGMAKKNSRREAMLAVDSIRDLAIGNLLPNRKLKYFRDHPLKSAGVTPKHLLLWYYEDSLKKVYFEFLTVLEEMSKDPLPHIKSKVLAYISDLLIAKPEQEANLLLIIVNKLGDQEGKVSSKAGFLLSTILQKHPLMNLTIVKEVERFLFRTGMNDRSRYTALNFLNQIVLSNRDQDTPCAKSLIEIYMAVFEQLAKSQTNSKGTAPPQKTDGQKMSAKAKKKLEDAAKEINDINAMNSKILGAIFIGVNRAFPFAKLTETAFEKHLQTIYKICYVGTFNVSIQALALIFQIESSKVY
ncbi:hypothetical protein HDU67_008105 [Dinochytrium kinnereticum]|nr:hypothetical protein HDU67_008105 [Dinochytrium kinnereticum]